MELHIKLEELVNILIDKKRGALLEKYNLELEAFEKIADSMKNGKWKFVSTG
ncbi:MAG: hypothetical protein V3R93_06250 [Candidatus Hydrothermarchaeaceae archaeon]